MTERFNPYDLTHVHQRRVELARKVRPDSDWARVFTRPDGIGYVDVEAATRMLIRALGWRYVWRGPGARD